MKVVIGLGNPGKKYERTRHNMGFIAVDSLRKKFNLNDEREKFQALVSEKNIDGEKVIFFKPQTFMNLSGNAVIEIINFYKLDPKKDIIVIYDDMDLPFGDIRIREKGSSGGHNGIKSIISHIGEEFIRIKCGIGTKEKDAIEYVLGEFNQTEQKNLDEILEKPIYQICPYIPKEQDSLFLKAVPALKSQRWTETFADMIPKEGGKSEGIEKAVELLGFSKDWICFGDGGNDKTMIQKAELGIAMGNASEEVKSVADYVTASVDEEGVTKALEHFGFL